MIHETVFNCKEIADGLLVKKHFFLKAFVEPFELPEMTVLMFSFAFFAGLFIAAKGILLASDINAKLLNAMA
jgi:hypothetical protein